ncbi:MAG: Jag N-terminal domain-containing protein [Sulfurimonas sp.]|nr:Jag N-terminal domain-containing protein [Sulfurimonas sp.]
MTRIESTTLEEAYQDAASLLECSVTQLKIEVVQYPSAGFLGLFKKTAIIIADIDIDKIPKVEEEKTPKPIEKYEKTIQKQEPKTQVNKKYIPKQKKQSQKIINDTIMPESFVSTQEVENENNEDSSSYLASYDDKFDNKVSSGIQATARIVEEEINTLFSKICFEIENIKVRAYDENTLLVEFQGVDSALLIGKEGYRYKAISYMVFNWINTKYQLQLRLEIAEFLKNQEESVSRYLKGVIETVKKDGRAQTKILDGVLIQIALRELRDIYPDKYVAIRSTRDGLKYIIINNYHS